MTNYLWDSLDRSQELNYPAQWGQSGNPRKKVEPLYDMANRMDTLKYDTTNYASGFVYNAASQVESLNVAVRSRKATPSTAAPACSLNKR